MAPEKREKPPYRVVNHRLVYRLRGWRVAVHVLFFVSTFDSPIFMALFMESFYRLFCTVARNINIRVFFYLCGILYNV